MLLGPVAIVSWYDRAMRELATKWRDSDDRPSMITLFPGGL